MDKDAVIAQIAAAFDGVSRAGGVSLREGRVIDDYGTDAERDAARLLDTDTRWQDVPDDDLNTYGTSLCFVDPIGFRYYLPAYLCYSLRMMGEGKGGGVDNMLFHLDLRGSDDGIRETLSRRFGVLTPAQAQAVGSFLQFVVENGCEYEREDAARIFRDYWNYYP